MNLTRLQRVSAGRILPTRYGVEALSTEHTIFNPPPLQRPVAGAIQLTPMLLRKGISVSNATLPPEARCPQYYRSIALYPEIKGRFGLVASGRNPKGQVPKVEGTLVTQRVDFQRRSAPSSGTTSHYQ